MRTRNSGKRLSSESETRNEEIVPEKVRKVTRLRSTLSPKEGSKHDEKDTTINPDRGSISVSVKRQIQEVKTTSANKRKSLLSDDSSDSSSDEYLVPSHKIDLNSDFFKVEKKEAPTDFAVIENKIFDDINRLSESEDSDLEEVQSIQKINTSAHSVGVSGVAVKTEGECDDLKSVEQKTLGRGNGYHPPRKSVEKKRSRKKNNMKDEHDAKSKDLIFEAIEGSIKLVKSEDDCLVKHKEAGVRKCNTATGNKTKIKKGDGLNDVADSRPRRKNIEKQQMKMKGGKKAQTNSSVKSSLKNKSSVLKKDPVVDDVSNLNVLELLAIGESQKFKGEIETGGDSDSSDEMEADEEEDNVADWEEVDVADVQDLKPEVKHVIPKEGISVTVAVPNMHQKKKKGFDMEGYIKRRLNRVRRDIHILMHKAHLLCWLAHGNYVNTVLNSEVLMGLSLSLIPSKHCYPDRHTDLNYLQSIVQWFAKLIKVEPKNVENKSLVELLQCCFQKKIANSKRDLVLMFICVLRSLGISTRLVLSLQPISLKPTLSEINNKNLKKNVKKKETKHLKKSNPSVSSKEVVRKRRDIMSKEEAVKRIKEAAAAKMNKSSKSIEKNQVKDKNENGKVSTENSGQRSLRTRKSVRKYIDDPELTDDNESETDTQKNHKPKVRDDEKIKNGDKSTRKTIAKPNEPRESKVTENSSESDYSPDLKEPKRRSSNIRDRRVLSSDSPSSDPGPSKGRKKERCDVWIEVFLESEEKWISVDINNAQVHCVKELYSRATQPVLYVLAWQGDGSIRDVTQRYCPQWHTYTRRNRVDESWWQESLRPFRGRWTARDREETEDLERQLQDRPLPTSMSEYKNHPLYVLKKDLLKFQAIYPPDAPPLGFVRGHPVYARECVHTLHSREIWLKEAKVVKLGESPYKIVKARPKWDRMSGQVVKDLPLEIFGFWQVEDYVPPAAEDGKVPRNAYGNVELFKPCMLPKGTVHMQIPGLNRVARKLQIDCAPAVIGFDFHCGASHPVYDGFVVCEEFKDVLAEAWQEEEEAADKRYEEKRLKRIYGNWRRLIKGLLIRERLKARYAFGSISDSAETKKVTKKSKFRHMKKLKVN